MSDRVPFLVDFHAHILPGADHGSDSSAVSLAQLGFAAKAGVDGVIATPHFYPDRHKLHDFLISRDGSYCHLLDRMKETGVTSPAIRVGAEVLMCQGLEELEGIEHLCVRGTKTILLELPFSYFDDTFPVAVSVLAERGFSPVLAHADRYDAEHIEKMISAGAKIQLNADALSGLVRPKHLYSWIDRGYVVGLGSDIHKKDAAAYRRFSKAIAHLGDAFPEIAEASAKVFREAAV